MGNGLGERSPPLGAQDTDPPRALVDVRPHQSGLQAVSFAGLDEDDLRFGRVVLIFHPGRTRRLPCFGAVLVRHNGRLPAGTRPQLLERNAAGPEDGRRVRQAVDDGALDADGAGAAVEDERDAPGEVVLDVLGGGGRGPGGGVGGGGGERDAGGFDEREREEGGWHAGAEGGEAGGHFGGEGGVWGDREEDGQGAGPEALD